MALSAEVGRKRDVSQSTTGREGCMLLCFACVECQVHPSCLSQFMLGFQVTRAVQTLVRRQGWSGLPLYALGGSSGGALVMLLALRMQLQVCPCITYPTLGNSTNKSAAENRRAEAACMLILRSL